MQTREFLLHASIEAESLDAWIDAGWLLPRRAADEPSFAEIDVARVRLIRDLRQDLGINEEGVTVVLDLIDQLHGMRRTLRGVLSSLETQPDATRRQIVEDLRRRLADLDDSTKARK